MSIIPIKKDNHKPSLAWVIIITTKYEITKCIIPVRIKAIMVTNSYKKNGWIAIQKYEESNKYIWKVKIK